MRRHRAGVRRGWGIAAGILLSASAGSAQQRSATAPTAPPRARVVGTLESGAAVVQQPLVRSGAAFYLAPGAQLTARDLTVGGSAVLATGSPQWQSFLGSGYFRSPALRDVRLIGTGQLLKTTGIAHTIHGDLGAEWRRGTAGTTGVLRARGGQMRFSGAWYPDLEAGGTVLHTHGATSIALDGTFAAARRPATLQQQLGVRAGAGAAFTARTLDFTPRMIWERSRLRADASVALRAVQQGATGTRVGPQLSFTLQTARGVSLFVGGVQRLPDVRAGIPSGRTALLGVRMEGRRLLVRPVPAATTAATLLVINGTLVIDSGPTDVEKVELRGDFTEWVPRTCARSGSRRFTCGAAPAAGTWRVAIRSNNGNWVQPANLAGAADDFGSVDGVLMTNGKP
ncbi:MAG: hypothetical protein IT355_20985 [Gemmatimonadaceae bacterium]|nr:hypothetical protein [Gemmatimonadaceae bacterium]